MKQEIERLRSDIGVLEQATGLGLSFDQRDARSVALGSLLGVPAAIWSLVGPTQPPITGIVLVATLLAVVGASSLDARRAGKTKAEEPLRWREHKFGIALSFFVTLAALAYLMVGVWGGLSLWGLALPTAVFIGGVATAVPAIADRRRSYLLGGCFWTIAYAVVLPFCDDRQLMLATALWILLAGATSAAIMFRQLRSQKVDAAD